MTPNDHEREALRHFRLGVAHGEIGEIQDEIERLRHRAGMLEIYIASGGEGEPPEGQYLTPSPHHGAKNRLITEHR